MSRLSPAITLAQERGSRDVRQRAEEALLHMTPDNMFRCGLTCDYGSECLAFLRENFDVDDPDPALTKAAVEAFCSKMELLFCKGLILGDAAAVPAVQAASSPSRTITQIVYQQVETPEPILASTPVTFLNLLLLKDTS